MKDHKLIQSLFKQSFKISFNPATRALVCSVWLWMAACCSSILFSKRSLCFSIDKRHMSQIPFIYGSSSWSSLDGLFLFRFGVCPKPFFDSPVSFGFGGEFSGVEVLGCEPGAVNRTWPSLPLAKRFYLSHPLHFPPLDALIVIRSGLTASRVPNISSNSL